MATQEEVIEPKQQLTGNSGDFCNKKDTFVKIKDSEASKTEQCLKGEFGSFKKEERQLKKPTTEQFYGLYSKYYASFGINNDNKQQTVHKNFHQAGATRDDLDWYYDRLNEVEENYLVEKDGIAYFNVKKLLHNHSLSGDLSGMILKGLDFSGASFAGIDLTHTRIRECSFFTDTNQEKTDQCLHTDFKGATIHNTTFIESTGLETCKGLPTDFTSSLDDNPLEEIHANESSTLAPSTT